MVMESKKNNVDYSFLLRRQEELTLERQAIIDRFDRDAYVSEAIKAEDIIRSIEQIKTNDPPEPPDGAP